MKHSLSRTVLFSLLASLALPLAAQQGDTAARETARRQAAVRDAMQQVEEARSAYSEKKYSDAVEHYRNALAVLPKAPATEKQLAFIKDSLSDALIAKGMDYRSVGRYEEAVAFMKEAVALSPDNKRAKDELLRTQDPVRHNPALTPQHIGNVAEVERLLQQGYGELDLGNYDKADEIFRSVAKYDAYNTAAMRGLEAVSKRRMSALKSAHDASRAKALEDVDATWHPGAQTDDLDDSVPAAVAQSGDAVPEDLEAENRIAAALQDMVMPQITFDDASVMDVMEALQAQITRFEQNGKGAGRHINLTSNFGTVDSEGYKTIMARTVRLSLNDVSVKDVLDMLSKQLGITYYVSSIGVELSYSGKDFGPMVERIYTVSPHFFDVQKEEGGDDDEDDFNSSSSRMVVRRVNPVTALKEMGISFPQGSNARYDAASRKLTVLNTPYNQEEIAGLVNVPIDSTDRAVVLNVMGIEVSQDDLEALGYEWLVNLDLTDRLNAGGVADMVSDAAMPITGGIPAQSRSMTDGLRAPGALHTASTNIDKLISSGAAGNFADSMSGVQQAPGIFALRGVWAVGDVSVIMRGLSQKKGADILYNPRLILTPGMDEQVIFANVREMYYPETYSEPQISSSSFNFGNNNNNNNGNGNNRNGYSTTATAAHPEEFTRFGMSEDGVGGIGTVLQVHQAEVAQDGQHVTLAMTVTVNEFEGFVNWGTPIKSFLFNPLDGNKSTTEIILSDNKILKPVFKRHMENTKITVAPGAVLVMGGLQEASVVRYEDKLPVMGDLPLVGRFFRSSGEEKVRKAFLFFAKVDLVDPSGKDPRSGIRPSDKDEI